MEMANCGTPLSSVSFSSTVRRSTVYTSAVEKFSNLFTLGPVQFSAQKLCLHLNRRLTQSFSFGSVVTVLGVFLFISIVSNPSPLGVAESCRHLWCWTLFVPQEQQKLKLTKKDEESVRRIQMGDTFTAQVTHTHSHIYSFESVSLLS